MSCFVMNITCHKNTCSEWEVVMDSAIVHVLIAVSAQLVTGGGEDQTYWIIYMEFSAPLHNYAQLEWEIK